MAPACAAMLSCRAGVAQCGACMRSHAVLSGRRFHREHGSGGAGLLVSSHADSKQALLHSPILAGGCSQVAHALMQSFSTCQLAAVVVCRIRSHGAPLPCWHTPRCMPVGRGAQRTQKALGLDIFAPGERGCKDAVAGVQPGVRNLYPGVQDVCGLVRVSCPCSACPCHEMPVSGTGQARGHAKQ